MANTEERVLRSYVECFNRHDLAGVMACFDDQPVIVDMFGKRHEGRDQIQRFYEIQFAMFPDARCDLKVIAGQGGTGVAETQFRGTHAKTGMVVEACGPEVVEFARDKIKELRDYHRVTPA